jgi:hypothetical protein
LEEVSSGALKDGLRFYHYGEPAGRYFRICDLESLARDGCKGEGVTAVHRLAVYDELLEIWKCF